MSKRHSVWWRVLILSTFRLITGHLYERTRSTTQNNPLQRSGFTRAAHPYSCITYEFWDSLRLSEHQLFKTKPSIESQWWNLRKNGLAREKLKFSICYNIKNCLGRFPEAIWTCHPESGINPWRARHPREPRTEFEDAETWAVEKQALKAGWARQDKKNYRLACLTIQRGRYFTKKIGRPVKIPLFKGRD